MQELSNKKRVSMPRFADYNLMVKYVLEQGLDVEYITPPAITRRTEELGEKYSPDYICTPFKTTFGSMIELLENGCDTILMSYGACRLGYFGEIQNILLHDLGYDFELINLQNYSTGRKKDWLKLPHDINPKVNIPRLGRICYEAKKMTAYFDEITYEYYKKAAFDPSHKINDVYKDFLLEMEVVENRDNINKAYIKAKTRMNNLAYNIPDFPIRVGIVGEFFTVMDANANRSIEKKLVDMGVQVERWMNVTNRMFNHNDKNLMADIQKYCTYEMGPTSTANIWATKKYVQAGFDGIIHIKSAHCTPEIDVVPILRTVCNEYKTPFITLTFDSQTSDVGIMTRLEAFFDMMLAKRKAIK